MYEAKHDCDMKAKRSPNLSWFASYKSNVNAEHNKVGTMPHKTAQHFQSVSIKSS